MGTTYSCDVRPFNSIKKPLARCAIFLLLLTLLAGCTVEQISPGGTIELRLGDRAYHIWWRIADGPGDQLRYSLLARAIDGTGITAFALSFHDAAMQSLHQASQAANDSAAAVFEGVVPEGSASIQLAVTSGHGTTHLSFATEGPLLQALPAMRDSQEVGFVVTTMANGRSRALRIRVSETAKFLWGSKISLEVTAPPSSLAEEDAIDIEAGYYSGFTDRLAAWRAEGSPRPEDGPRTISACFQTEDLAYTRLSYLSGARFMLTFHVYAPCPFSGS